MKTNYDISLNVELNDNHCDELVSLFDDFLKRHADAVIHASANVRSSFRRHDAYERAHDALFGPHVDAPKPPIETTPWPIDPAEVAAAAKEVQAVVKALAEVETPCAIEVVPDEAIPEASTRTITIDKDTVYGALRELVKTKGAAAAAAALKTVGAAKFTEVGEESYAALYDAIEAAK